MKYFKSRPDDCGNHGILKTDDDLIEYTMISSECAGTFKFNRDSHSRLKDFWKEISEEEAFLDIL